MYRLFVLFPWHIPIACNDYVTDHIRERKRSINILITPTQFTKPYVLGCNIWGHSSYYEGSSYTKAICNYMRALLIAIMRALLIYSLVGGGIVGVGLWALGLLYTFTPVRFAIWSQNEGPPHIQALIYIQLFRPMCLCRHRSPVHVWGVMTSMIDLLLIAAFVRFKR